MKFSLLTIALITLFVLPRESSCAEQDSTSNPQITPLTNNATIVSLEPKNYLLPYHDTEGPGKYLEWLWKDPINLLTRPAYWHGEEWETFGIDVGITGALFPLDNTVRDFVTMIIDPRHSTMA